VFFPRRSSMMFSVMSVLNPKRSSNSRTKSKPPSEVTREPWKSTFLEIHFQRGVERELKRLCLTHWVKVGRPAIKD